jgi:hypothetical protein
MAANPAHAKAWGINLLNNGRFIVCFYGSRHRVEPRRREKVAAGGGNFKKVFRLSVAVELR